MSKHMSKADKFRSAVTALLQLPDHDWNDWEYDWLLSESRRRSDYVYSDKEHAVLDRLRNLAKSFTGYDGYTAAELITIAYQCRFDIDDDACDFLERLHRSNRTELKLRQMRRVVGICRAFAGLDLARDIEPVLIDDYEGIGFEPAVPVRRATVGEAVPTGTT
jgi:hypothetical protein